MPSWWDRFGEEWSRLGLADDPTHAQADAGFAFIGQAPPTVELFNSLLQWNDAKDNWLFGQIANVIFADGVLPDAFDLEQLLRALDNRQKILLSGPTTFFVDAVNGNDVTGSGETDNPWRTVQHAVQWCLTNVEPANNTATLQLAPGTYEPFGLHNSWNGQIFVRGDPLTPRAYIVRNTNGNAISAHYGGVLFVDGISVETPSGSGLVAVNGGIIVYANVAFGPCSLYQMQALASGQILPWDTVSYSVYGGAACHMYAAYGGIVSNARSTVAIQNNPAFTMAFVQSTLGSGIQSHPSTYAGAAQGVRAVVDANAIIVNGGIDPNVSFPGTLPAVSSRGGLFV
jgi:hypothetical protein